MLERISARTLDVLDWGRVLALAILGTAMIAVFAAGIFKVTLAAWLLAKATARGAEGESVVAVTEFLKGFEFFFLAPLGLLTFKTLIKYVRVQVDSPKSLPIFSAEDREAATRDVDHSKILIGSLIAAFLITDLVSKVVSGEAAKDFRTLGSEGGVLLITILYVWSLPRGRNQ
jgi:hypothetical protein